MSAPLASVLLKTEKTQYQKQAFTEKRKEKKKLPQEKRRDKPQRQYRIFKV
jgi:hypothetical protein